MISASIWTPSLTATHIWTSKLIPPSRSPRELNSIWANLRFTTAISENFLSFSPTLTTLKQEPQTDQIKPSPKVSLDNASTSPSIAIAKLDEVQNSPSQAISGQDSANGSGSAANGKHDVNSGLACGCGSPQGSPLANAEYELNEKGKPQQLSVLDPAKIEIGSANGATHAEDHKWVLYKFNNLPKTYSCNEIISDWIEVQFGLSQKR